MDQKMNYEVVRRRIVLQVESTYTMVDIGSGIKCLGPRESQGEDATSGLVLPESPCQHAISRRMVMGRYTYSFSNTAVGTDERFSLQKT